MKKNKILKTLKNADRPIPIEKLSEETGMNMASLRVDLYRLQEEGEVESREEKGKLHWKIKVSNPVEEKYEKMSEKSTSG